MEVAHERQSREEERNWILGTDMNDYIKLSLDWEFPTLGFFFFAKNGKLIFAQERKEHHDRCKDHYNRVLQ